MPKVAPAGSVLRGDVAVPDEVDARLSTTLERLVARPDIHHALFAVASGDGSQRWSAAAGPAGPDSFPLRPDTPFFIASITKRFIATLILQASERGELDLDDPIVRHLPAELTGGLHVHQGVDCTAAITVRHLLSHTSGLPDYWERPRSGASLFDDLAAGRDRSWGLHDVVRMARADHTPHFPPQNLAARRQRARYSDTGFQLLIAIAERVTGRPFGALLDERILAPLGLERTWLPAHGEPPPGAPPPACIYAKTRPLELPGMITSSNDLVSTAADLLRFQRALLASELFARPATGRLLTERANLLGNMVPIRYGLGTMIFRVGRLNGPGRRKVTLIGHSGVTGTWLFHCPELDVDLAGTIDAATGKRLPFRLMARLLRAWHE